MCSSTRMCVAAALVLMMVPSHSFHVQPVGVQSRIFGHRQERVTRHALPAMPKKSPSMCGRGFGSLQLRATFARANAGPAKTQGFKLETAYILAGSATAVSWIAIAVGALATYKPWRYMHNSIGVLQALTALPLIWACFSGLSAAAREGWLRLRGPDCRRLNLGLAAASIWSAITVIFAPAFTSALVRTVDPVIYPLPLVIGVVLTHIGTAVLCLSTWRKSVISPSPSRMLSGVLGSQWRVTSSDDPDQAPLFANEYNFLSMAFTIFTALAIFAPLPLATVPSILGKRMCRAFGAMTLLAAVMMYELKVAAQDGRLGSGCEKCITCHLKTGILFFASSHLAIAGARALLESPSLYPAAMTCIPAVVVSMLVYALAAYTSFRDKQFSACKRAAADANRPQNVNNARIRSESCEDGQNI
mmetsp:Transcript_6781/g.10073  ORF Transcript_6781/g.10073 Transcript_6781/m.10073 type:complete len:417 (-) Transcript_6781:247-1497(-)